ncbi:nucleotidyltransferase family protein [Saprospiraceae bacterium]|nr:nucleotidyltransferase family protein [Saprospiraceae bacterium]
MRKIQQHIISVDYSVKLALSKLDALALDAILFIVDENKKLVGSLTDGDIRRGLINGLGIEDNLLKFVQPNPKYVKKEDFNITQLQDWRAKNIMVIPVINNENRIVNIVNFRLQKSFLPIDAVIMAGGIGSRLKPLTNDTPKPLLKIGDKPIIEYNVDRLKSFGVKNITLTIKYLGQQLVDYFGNGSNKDLSITYVEEDIPLGTIGSVSLIDNFYNEYILVMNSDLLTNINYEEMFGDLIDKEGDMIVATTPYEVEIPYGVIETEGDQIVRLKEKPTYTYYANAGIYIIKKEHLNLIPKNEHFNATDLMEKLYSNDKKVIHFPILDYWLDIGKLHDYNKAQNDVKHIKF